MAWHGRAAQAGQRRQVFRQAAGGSHGRQRGSSQPGSCATAWPWVLPDEHQLTPARLLHCLPPLLCLHLRTSTLTLRCTAPHCTAPHCTAPHRTAPHRTALHCTRRPTVPATVPATARLNPQGRLVHSGCNALRGRQAVGARLRLQGSVVSSTQANQIRLGCAHVCPYIRREASHPLRRYSPTLDGSVA